MAHIQSDQISNSPLKDTYNYVLGVLPINGIDINLLKSTYTIKLGTETETVTQTQHHRHNHKAHTEVR